MRAKKKVLSLVLALAMVLSLLPAAALAVDTEGYSMRLTTSDSVISVVQGESVECFINETVYKNNTKLEGMISKKYEVTERNYTITYCSASGDVYQEFDSGIVNWSGATVTFDFSQNPEFPVGTYSVKVSGALSGKVTTAVSDADAVVGEEFTVSSEMTFTLKVTEKPETITELTVTVNSGEDMTIDYAVVGGKSVDIPVVVTNQEGKDVTAQCQVNLTLGDNSKVEGVTLQSRENGYAYQFYPYAADQLENTTITFEAVYEELSASDTIDLLFTNQQVAAQAVISDGESVEYFSSLQAAIDAAGKGDTVELLDDVTVTEGIVVNKAITLDLGSYTVSVTEPKISAITVVSGGDLEITGSGTISAIDNPSADDEEQPRPLQVIGNTNANTWDNTNTTATLTIDKDVTVTSSVYYDNCVYIAGKGAVLNVYGTLEGTNKGAAVQGNGTNNGTTNAGGTEINIYNGANLKSNGLAMYIPQAGEVNIYGGTVEGYAGIGIKSGTLNITGGTVKGVANDTVLSDDYSDTGRIAYDGSAIVIDSYIGYAGQMNLNISGDATIESVYSTAIREIGNNAGESNVVSIAISGGTVKSTLESIRVREITKSTVSITGGEFNKEVNSDYVATGYEPVYNESTGFYTVDVKDGMEAVANADGASSSAQVGGSFANDESKDGEAVSTTGNTVQIDVTTGTKEQDSTEPVANDDVTSTQVTIGAEALESVNNNNTVTSVELVTDVATVTVNEEAWNTLTKNADGSAVTLTIEETTPDAGIAAQWEVTAQRADGKDVFSEKNSGSATIAVTVTYKTGLAGVEVYCLDEGLVQLVKSEYADGFLTWWAPHFSSYGTVEPPENPVASVAVNGGVPVYVDSLTGLQSILSGGNVKTADVTLVDDVDAGENTQAILTIPAGVEVDLDLNGKTISGTSTTPDPNTSAAGNYTMISNAGTLTIRDSEGGGKITYTYTGVTSNWAHSSNTITNTGTLTLESGTVENATQNLGTHIFFAIDNISGGANAAETVINGGTVSCPNYRAIRQFANGDSYQNSLEVNGGEIEGMIWLQIPHAGDSNAALDINGGKLTGNNTSDRVVYADNSNVNGSAEGIAITIGGAVLDGDVKMETNGGTMTIEKAEVTGSVTNAGTGTITIDGAEIGGDVANESEGEIKIVSGTVNGQVYKEGDGEIIVTGGSFPNTDVSEFVPEDGAYTVKFDLNSGTGTFNPIVVPKAESGSATVTLPTAEPTKTNFVFVCWKAEDGNTYNPGDEVTITGDTTFTAQWRDAVHTVTFEANGETWTVNVNDSAAVAQPEDPVWEGHTFSGWFLGSEKYNFTTPVTADITLTAEWDINTYTVTFESNGGTAVKTQEVKYLGTVTEPKEPTRKGYQFAGWFTEKGKKYDFDTKVTESFTLYAYWTETAGTTAVRYDIDVERPDNGSIEIWPESAAMSTVITVTVTPDKGYVLDELIVTDSKGNELKLTDKGNGKFTFRMPNGDVTVEATFVEEAEEETGPVIVPPTFTDVSPNAWYYQAVAFVSSYRLMNGTDTVKGTFEPETTLSRAMLAQIAYNMEGASAIPVTGNAFTDVSADAWYAPAVNWAAAAQIITGDGNGNYNPEAPITREQLAAILYRYAAYKGYDTTQGGMAAREFSDFDQISDYAVTAMTWAVNAGVINGADGLLKPQGNASRAEVAQMIMNFFVNVVK